MTTALEQTKKIEFYARVRGGSIELSIYDKIGSDGITPKMIGAALATGKNSDVTVNIHSPGGSAFDGIAIYNLLKNHPGKVTAVVDGLAASAASVIAMAADHIQMNESAMLMIHGIQGIAVGNAETHRRNYETMEKLNNSVATIYANRTGGDKEAILEMMQHDMWLTAQEAVADGYADEIISGTNPTNCFDLSELPNVPQQVSDLFGLRLDAKPDKEPITMNSEEIRNKYKAAADDLINEGELAGYGQAKTDLTALLEACNGDKSAAFEAFVSGKSVQQTKDSHAATLAQQVADLQAKLEAAENKAKALADGADPILTNAAAQIKDEPTEDDAKKAKVYEAAKKIKGDYARNAYIASVGLDPTDFKFD